MKFKVVYETRVRCEILVEAESKEAALYAVQNGQVAGEVDIEDLDSPDIIGCEVVQ